MAIETINNGLAVSLSEKAFSSSKGYLNRGAINRAALMAGIGSAMAGIGSTTKYIGAPLSTKGLLLGSVQAGIMESFGVGLEGWAHRAKSTGFMGWREAPASYRKGADWAMKRTKSKALQSISGGLRAGGGMALRGLGGIYTAYSVYEGYQQGGVIGATKGLAESAMWNIGIHYGMGALKPLISAVGTAAPVLAPMAIGAAAGYGAYKAAQAGQKYYQGLRQMEMGQSDQIQSAINTTGAATMRQRSLMALSNTHLNARMALGNEGFLCHRSFVY